MTTEKLYKLAEVENLLSVSRRTLLRWISQGKLHAVKLAGHGRLGHWRVPQSALDAAQPRK